MTTPPSQTTTNQSSEVQKLAALIKEHLPPSILSFTHEVVGVEKGAAQSTNRYCAGVVIGAYKSLGDGRSLRRTVTVFIGSTANDEDWTAIQRSPNMATSPFRTRLMAEVEKELSRDKIVEVGVPSNHILLARDYVPNDTNIYSLIVSILASLYK